MLRLADFYAGCGGVSLGFEQTGKFKTVFAIDIKKHCRATYDANHEAKLTVQDINKLNISDIPEFDILCGGFNCQPFSVAGVRKGFEDDRTRSVFKMFEIIKQRKPKVVFLENVKGLLHHDGGKSLNRITDLLNESGYKTVFVVSLNTMRVVQLPQSRPRIYIIGFRNKINTDRYFNFNSLEYEPDYSTLLESVIPDKYYYKPETCKFYSALQEKVTQENHIYSLWRREIKNPAHGMCPTIISSTSKNSNIPIIKQNGRIRCFTPRECFNFQGYPQTFTLIGTDHKLYSMAGNSVSVPVIKMLAEEIIKILRL